MYYTLTGNIELEMSLNSRGLFCLERKTYRFAPFSKMFLLVAHNVKDSRTLVQSAMKRELVRSKQF